MKGEAERKVNDILKSFEGVQRATPQPFFFTRLQARMSKEAGFWGRSSWFFTNPLWVTGSVFLILLFNFYVVSYSTEENSLNMAQQNTDLTTIEEYSQVNSTLFDLENIRP